MPRPPRPDDLYRLRIATEPRLSPDGRWAVVHAPDRRARLRRLPARALARPDRRRRRRARAAPADARRPARPPRPVLARTAGRSRSCRTAGRSSRRSPDASRKDVKDREDTGQVHLLPLDGPGEARRLTDLPRGVSDFEWSPDGTRLVVTIDVARGDRTRRTRGAAAQAVEAGTRRAARLRLPVHRPARLHAQRRRVPVRPGRPPVARRRRDRRARAA